MTTPTPIATTRTTTSTPTKTKYDEQSKRQQLLVEKQFLQQQYSLNTKFLSFVILLGFLLCIYAVYVEYKIEHIHHQKEMIRRRQQEQQLVDDGSLPFFIHHDHYDNNVLNYEYKSYCDIEMIGASCSKVFQLPCGKLLSYLRIIPSGHILDVPNAMIGTIYYIFQFVLLLYYKNNIYSIQRNHILLYMNMIISSLAMLSSIFLAYLLTFVVYDLCILCWTTHITNSILFYNNVILKLSLIKYTTTTNNKNRKHYAALAKLKKEK